MKPGKAPKQPYGVTYKAVLFRPPNGNSRVALSDTMVVMARSHDWATVKFWRGIATHLGEDAQYAVKISVTGVCPLSEEEAEELVSLQADRPVKSVPKAAAQAQSTAITREEVEDYLSKEVEWRLEVEDYLGKEVAKRVEMLAESLRASLRETLSGLTPKPLRTEMVTLGERIVYPITESQQGGQKARHLVVGYITKVHSQDVADILLIMPTGLARAMSCQGGIKMVEAAPRNRDRFWRDNRWVTIYDRLLVDDGIPWKE